MPANDLKRIVHLKLDDLLALPKAKRAAVASAFKFKYGQHSVAISSEGVRIERRNAANQTVLDDAVDMTKVRTFLRVFRPVLTNLRVTVDEESGGRASESVAFELKHLGGKFPALKHFSLEVLYGGGHRKRSYAGDVRRMVAANAQLEWLSLDFDLPWHLLATVATACTQLHRLSVKCDVSAFYAYAGKAVRFEHVKCLELAFFDLRSMPYEPKLLTHFPFQFDRLDELRLDLTHGGYGNDFAALITVHRGLTKLRILSVMFDHDKESPLVAYAEQLPALKELVLDAHAVPTDDLEVLLNVDGTLQSVALLDMSEYQYNSIWDNCDGWICGELMLRKSISKRFSPRYDLRLERAPANDAARDGLVGWNFDFWGGLSVSFEKGKSNFKFLSNFSSLSDTQGIAAEITDQLRTTVEQKSIPPPKTPRE